MYNAPGELTREYDMIANGNWNETKINDITYSDPSHHSGYGKKQLGYLKPFTLTYGTNANIRLYKTEEADFSNTSNRIKLIKVPLRPPGDSGFLQLVKYNSSVQKYAGEEYLLLEWRCKGDLEGGIYNFDRAIPHDGLLVYRIIESNPNALGDDYANTIKIVDATPALPPFTSLLNDYYTKEQSSILSTPATFGTISGVNSYTAGEQWNWKNDPTVIADFQLSAGYGTKTIYAKFMDLNGTIVGSTSLNINYSSGDSTPPAAPTGVRVN
jgi:hypothetical protein